VDVTAEDERLFWMMMRQAWLMMVDAVERYVLKLTPRTSELRKDKRSRE
jgi:hypothetical protein